MTLSDLSGYNIRPDEAAIAGSALCHACGGAGLFAFYSVRGIPTQTTVLLDSEQEAREYPRGDVLLGLCTTCGFIQNVLFNPELVDYSLPTEESQAFSPLFADYASKLARRLVAEHDLRGKTVLEIGSGKGDFLLALAANGIGKGIGVDPGFLPDRLSSPSRSLVFMKEFYGPEHTSLTGDLVVARHILEHVPNVREFLMLLAGSTAKTENGALFLEVPDTGRILDEDAFWDIYYEHCSYFTAESIDSALNDAGLALDRVELGFNSQYILGWAHPLDRRPVPGGEEPERASVATDKVSLFAARTSSSIDWWRGRIGGQLDRGGKVAIWGASSKAVAFISSIAITTLTVVDINPHKQGKWLPGVAIEVLPPSALEEIEPDLVIAMNPAYKGEILSDLALMGLTSDLVALGETSGSRFRTTH